MHPPWNEECWELLSMTAYAPFQRLMKVYSRSIRRESVNVFFSMRDATKIPKIPWIRDYLRKVFINMIIFCPEFAMLHFSPRTPTGDPKFNPAHYDMGSF